MNDTRQNIRLHGAGWVDERAAGGLAGAWRTGQVHALHAGRWPDGGVFERPVKNAGRFDDASRRALIACALALLDAGVPPSGGSSPGLQPRLGLIGGSAAGSLDANRAYFQDYISAGRKLARGNLFIYTLPTSPLAETAIHLGLQGPLLYVTAPAAAAASVVRTAATLLASGAADGLLAVWLETCGAVAFLLRPAGMAAAGLPSADELAAVLAEAGTAAAVCAALARVAGGRELACG